MKTLTLPADVSYQQLPQLYKQIDSLLKAGDSFAIAGNEVERIDYGGLQLLSCAALAASTYRLSLSLSEPSEMLIAAIELLGLQQLKSNK